MKSILEKEKEILEAGYRYEYPSSRLLLGVIIHYPDGTTLNKTKSILEFATIEGKDAMLIENAIEIAHTHYLASQTN